MLGDARYAVYFVPRDGTALAAFGARVFGADAAASGIGEAAIWNTGARRYGFHATLKAPFHLKPGCTQADVIETARNVAASLNRFEIPKLEVSLVDDFIALTPLGPSDSLRALGDTCVRGFEPLRAPLSRADIERRLASGLTSAELAYLDAWGYPYVFEGFQFHMTLTDALAPMDAARLRVALAAQYAAFDGPIAIDAITVCRQPTRDASFEVWRRFDLGENGDHV